MSALAVQFLTGETRISLEDSTDKFKVLILLIIFSVVSALYRFIPSADDFLSLYWIYSGQFLIYGALIYVGRRVPFSLPILISVAILNRLLLIDITPILENDYFRYLWDGRVVANGINPYLYPPNSALLDPITVWYRDKIGWSDIRTIYPPLAQLFFGGLHLLVEDSLLALKAGLIFAEVCAGLFLVSSVRGTGERRLVTILYFFNPLLLKEIANSAHLDALPMFMSFAAVLCFMRYQNHRWIAWVLLALSVGAKSYPVLLLPLFLKLDSKRVVNLGLFLAILAALYLPFIEAGENLFSGAGAFGTYWIFNAGAFKVITSFANWALTVLFETWTATEQGRFILMNDYPAKVVVGIILGFYVYVVTRQLKTAEQLSRASLSILGMLLLLSPVVNAWYVLWLLPFACLERSVTWISFAYLVIGAYAWFWSESAAPAIRAVEYIALYSFLIWERYRLKQYRDLVSPN